MRRPAPPACRMAHAEAAAAVQRLSHAREALEQELARIVAARGDAERRRDQLRADLGRESEHLADADAALARLAEERQALERSITAAETTRGKAQAQLDEAGSALGAA